MEHNTINRCVLHALDIDSTNLGVDSITYTEDNYLSYHAAIGAYYGIAEDLTQCGESFLAEIGNHGLCWYAGCGSNVWKHFLNNTLEKCEPSFLLSCVQTLSAQVFDETVVKSISTLCRFLKRFAPTNVSVNPDACVQKFILNQHRLMTDCEYVDMFRFNQRLLNRVSSWFQYLTKGCADLIKVDIRACMSSFDVSPWMDIPNGADLEGHTTPAQKFQHMLQAIPNPTQVWTNKVPKCDPKPIRPLVPILDDVALMADIAGAFDAPDTTQFSRGHVVPKDWENSRFIGIEQCKTTVLAGYASKILLSKIRTKSHGAIDLNCNERNRKLCVCGANDGSYATIDLSDASDSVSVSLLEHIMDPDLFQLLNELRSHYVELEKFTVHLETFTTMGSRLTCPLQSAVYYSIIMASSDLACESDGSFLPVQPNEVAVYNDDIVVPTRIAPLVCENLTKLGFKVNTNKTFMSEEPNQTPFHARFRESCGVEAFKANTSCIAFDALYFPRAGIGTGLVGVRDVISLEHNVASFRINGKCAYPTAVHQLCQLVRSALPIMTESNVGSDYDDLWVDYPRSDFRYLPSGEFRDVEGQRVLVATDQFTHRCESHTTLRSMFTGRKPSNGEVEAAAVYRYLEFLKYGPSYDDELLKSLGVSSPRTVASLTREVDRRNCQVASR